MNVKDYREERYNKDSTESRKGIKVEMNYKREK
jgi:hypothetical protein